MPSYWGLRDTVSRFGRPPRSNPLHGCEGDGARDPDEQEGEGEEEHVAPERGRHLVGVHRGLGWVRTYLCLSPPTGVAKYKIMLI